MPRNKIVVKESFLPTHPGNIVTSATILWLFFDRYHAPTWLWYVVGTLMVLALIGTILNRLEEDQREPIFRIKGDSREN